METMSLKLQEHKAVSTRLGFCDEITLQYYAVFLSDPDGVKLEVTNYREERRHRHDNWDSLDP